MSFKRSSWTFIEFTLPSDIKDPLIRAFAKKADRPFWALKMYVEQTEDKELEAKLSIVEKYGSRIPELVQRLESCFENDSSKAGKRTILKLLLFYCIDYCGSRLSGITHRPVSRLQLLQDAAARFLVLTASGESRLSWLLFRGSLLTLGLILRFCWLLRKLI